ncbi:hypothetical protein RZS08_18655 [Arthrospira platensis SPKY1]|nr:hypothetical protein [Arthrospira platensis SPKY1]
MERNAQRIENPDARQIAKDSLRSLQQDIQNRARVAGQVRQYLNSDDFFALPEQQQAIIREGYQQILLQSIADVTGGPVGKQNRQVAEWLANNPNDPRASEIARELGLEDFIE